jgi:two-component system, OmpR family, sensor histidine kinase KdpD
MADERPNPDELLSRVQAEEADARRGRLRIFFGYAAGVGKTYAMLEAARREKAEGVDVVVGYVEPHCRPETEALLEGLEAIPHRLILYRGVTVREFDLDAALARRPRLILVDELAHTNAEGSRHAKRFQDVEELLDAGIDVWTTLNVQHVESLNDVIAQITSVVVRETLPDAVLEQADEIELVDVTPEELIERLKAGKVYVPQQAERALENFFQKGNLAALREMSVRQAAQRLRRDVDTARRERAATTPWATSERLLVCIGPSPTSAKLLRHAKRMAAAIGADWLAVAVDTGGTTTSAEHSRQALARHLQLAEQLGAETHTLVGADVADTILDYARSRNVTKIVVGKTAQPRWRRLLLGTVVDQLLERSGDIDVYAVRGESDDASNRPVTPATDKAIAWAKYFRTAGVLGLCYLLGLGFFHLKLSDTNIVMVFLLGVVFVATRYGRWPAIIAAVISVLTFDFFFVPPYYTFSVNDTQYVFTFGVMLVIGLVISALTAQVQRRLRVSQQQEQRTAALLRLTRQLSEIAGEVFLVQSASRQIAEIFGGEVVIFTREPNGTLEARFGRSTDIGKNPTNQIVARWVADNGQTAGSGTDTLPNATALFVPLKGSQRTVGVLGIRPADPLRFIDPEQRQLLETCASLIALAIERDQSLLEAGKAQLQVETEQLRNALLNSVSHDLRTPLAAIGGAGFGLLADSLNEKTRRELAQSIVDEAQRLTRLVNNLLDMTRLQAGRVVLNKQWHVMEEIIGSARNRLRKELAGHDVRVDIPPSFPLVNVDGLLLEEVIVNLLENAARYTPAGSRVEITAEASPDSAVIRVRDNGPGLPQGTEKRVFEKFYRGSAQVSADQRRGVGLGLAICQSILEVHGGRIEARNRPEGGAEFVLTLPCQEPPPKVPVDDAGTGIG